MAMTVQQIHPVAFAFSPGSLTASGGRPRDRPPHPAPPSTPARVVAGSKPWSSRFWMGIMPSTRWGNGWKRGDVGAAA